MTDEKKPGPFALRLARLIAEAIRAGDVPSDDLLAVRIEDLVDARIALSVEVSQGVVWDPPSCTLMRAAVDGRPPTCPVHFVARFIPTRDGLHPVYGLRPGPPDPAPSTIARWEILRDRITLLLFLVGVDVDQRGEFGLHITQAIRGGRAGVPLPPDEPDRARWAGELATVLLGLDGADGEAAPEIPAGGSKP
jgi:hypothetical protein